MSVHFSLFCITNPMPLSVSVRRFMRGSLPRNQGNRQLTACPNDKNFNFDWTVYSNRVILCLFVVIWGYKYLQNFHFHICNHSSTLYMKWKEVSPNLWFHFLYMIFDLPVHSCLLLFTNVICLEIFSFYTLLVTMVISNNFTMTHQH